MKLKNLLLENRTAILEKWLDAILETYPADTANFLKNQKNRFTNPVGHTILEGIEGIFENLLNGMDRKEVSSFLDNIIKIRAIQDFTPSQAITFIFFLKKVIREKFQTEMFEKDIAEDLFNLESKIDEIALLSFDIYMKCRERLYEIRAKELQNRTFRLLQRANLILNKEEGDLNEENDFILKEG